MTLLEAATIVLNDLLGEKHPDFASAYVLVAYTDQAELDALEFQFNADAMRHILASALAERTGATASLVYAGIETKPQFSHFALMNHVAWQPLVEKYVSQCEAEIPSIDVARTILLYPDCPKFGEACEYIMEIGEDVPGDFREQFTTFFNETVAAHINETGSISGEG
ncbi:TPA: hypothetical protein P0E30_003737 [Vibrio harveyi]|nr:hypothetical protein [Vibrio harveyi]